MLGKLILGVAARADKIGCTFAGGARFLSGFLCHHKASELVLDGRYLRNCVQVLPYMLMKNSRTTATTAF